MAAMIRAGQEQAAPEDEFGAGPPAAAAGRPSATPLLPPTAVPNRGGNGPPMLGLPIQARQQATRASPDDAAAECQKVVLPTEVARKGFITKTVTTPLRADARRKETSRSVPHPKEAAAERTGANLSGVYPRWAVSKTSEIGSELFSSQLVASPGPALSANGSVDFTPDVFLQARHKKLCEKYDMRACIGEGSGCAVYTVESKDNGRLYACKWLNKVDHDPKSLLKEIEMLKKLDHPNIVRLFDVLEDDAALYLILELCQGGDLCDKITTAGHLSEQDARIVMRQILDALAFCHANKVVHRDVKPENFLLTTQDPACLTLKLADFGVSTAIRPANIMSSQSREWPSFCVGAHEGAGSMPYMAPEMFSDLSSTDGVRSMKCDLWSAGALLFVALSGQYPFGDKAKKTPQMICSGKPVEFAGECWNGISEDAKDLIRKLMNHDIDKRLTAQQALQHSWFRDADTGLEHMLEESPSRAAGMLLTALRSWRKKPELRRWAIAAMARQLPEDHETQRLAKTVYKIFSDSSNTLRCEHLVDILADAQTELAGTMAASDSVSVSSKGSARSWKSMIKEGDVTGKDVKKKLKEVRNDTFSIFRRFASLSDTPVAESPFPETPFSVKSNDTAPEDLASLVSAVDGNKNGVVQYTLLVAALLPEHAYCDDLRISEVFQLFDVRGRGHIRPQDLRAALQCPKGHPGRFSQMVHDCDQSGDGTINLAEFRAMVRGEVSSHNQTPSGRTPANRTLGDRKCFAGTPSRKIVTL